MTQGIPELIKIAASPTYEVNRETKHKQDAKFGWYRYLVRFGISVFDDKSNEIIRYNIFKSKMLVRHSKQTGVAIHNLNKVFELQKLKNMLYFEEK